MSDKASSVVPLETPREFVINGISLKALFFSASCYKVNPKTIRRKKITASPVLLPIDEI